MAKLKEVLVTGLTHFGKLRIKPAEKTNKTIFTIQETVTENGEYIEWAVYFKTVESALEYIAKTAKAAK